MTLGNTIRSIKNIVTKNETQKLNDFNENLKYLVNYNQLKINEILSTDATQKINAKLHYSIKEIKKKFNETLFGVLSSNSYKHISLDSNLLDIIKKIGNNIDQIIPNLEKEIDNIKFPDPIKINDKKITGTGNPIDDGKSIESIKEDEKNLEKLEKIISNLEKRFKNNINTLEKIKKHQEAIKNIGSSTETPQNNDKNKEDTKSPQESLKQLRAQLEKNPIEIPDGFLPFQSSDTVAGETESLSYTEQKIKDFKKRQEQLDNFKKRIENIRERYKDNRNKLKNLLELQKFKKIITQGERKNEINSIINIGKALHLGESEYTSRIPDLVINAGGKREIPLNFLNNGPDISYSLCGKEGNKVEFDKNNSEYKITLKNLKKTIKLKGIVFHNDSQKMQINNLEIEPIEGITFPLDLNLNVKASISDASGITVDHKKPIHIKITEPRLYKRQRTNCYNQFETKINETISKEYTDEKMENIENEIIRKILYEGGNKSKIDKICKDKSKRDQFIKKIRNRLSVYTSSLSEDELKNGFKEHMTKEDGTLMTRKNNPLTFKDLYNENNFQKYINQNWKDCLKDYTEEQVYKKLSEYHDIILSTFFGSQTIPEGFSLTKLIKKSEDSNYTRFIIGKSHESKDNECKINNTEIQKYSVKTEIKGANSINATIQIDGNNPKTITAKNHDELIEKILNQKELPEKLTCDLAISVLKSIITICPTTISRKIQNQNFSDGTKEIIGNTIKVITENGNLKLCAYKISSESKKAGIDNIIDSVNIFDEENYKDKYDKNSINELKKGIFKISTEINFAMNSLIQDYQKVILGKDKSLLKYSIPKHFKGRDIKRWIGRTDNNFNFDTEIDDLEGKKIRISLNEGKFTISGIFNGKNYEFKNEDNLGNILNKKKNGNRIFDGVELKIINEINTKYIQELRKNKFISNKNYFISDLGENRTGRIYILRPECDLSYLETGNKGSKIFGKLEAGTIKSNNIPTNIHTCDDDEKREFFQNPILAGKLIKEMKKSLTLSFPKEASKKSTKRRERLDNFKKMTLRNKIKFTRSIPEIRASKIMNKIHKPKYSLNMKHIRTEIRDKELFKNEMVKKLIATADYLNKKESFISNDNPSESTIEQHKQRKGWYNKAKHIISEKLNKYIAKESAKKYLKALGLSFDGKNDEEIEAEANKKAEEYKKYLIENKES